MSHSETVQAIYAAFGRGDVPAILARLSPSIAWDDDASTPGVPWLQPRHGHGGVGDFFASLAGVEFELFRPTAIVEQGNLVIALVDVAATVKATGRRFAQVDEVHIWRFNAAGQAENFRHRVDTHQHVLASGA